MFALSMIVASAAAFGSDPSLIDQLKSFLNSDPAQAESLIRKQFKPEELTVGVPPYKQGTTVLFAVYAGPGKHKAAVSGDNLPETRLNRAGSLLAKLVTLKPGQGTTVIYTVDGKPTPKTYNLEVYTPNPVVEPPPGGRQGELRDMGEWKSAIFPDTTRKW